MKTNLITWLGKGLVPALAALAAVSCSERKFHIEGTLTEAADSTLYLENMSLDGPVAVDSVRLGASGDFSFSGECPGAPEFYRLRVGDQTVNLAVDSTETIRVEARLSQLPTGYRVEGSADCERIRQLTAMQVELTQRAMAVERNPGLSARQSADSILRLTADYKRRVTDRYIFADPKAASSYFALFQTLGGYLIFDPKASSDDIKVFAAVATCWDTFYPGSVRGENLHNIAIEGRRNQRIMLNRQREAIDPAKVTASGVIDIRLEDNKGRERTLTGLAGKVVLLDFHLFSMADSPKRILMLRELYSKYSARGLEIYQVSFDSDEHFWKQQTASLPWICVRDADGVNSQRLAVYNVRSLPEYFLIDRGNNLVSRSEQVKDLDRAIAALLGKK